MLKNYIKLEDEKKAASLINGKLKLDKNRLIYKYNLYKLYKLQGDEKEAISVQKELNKIKANSLIDFIDLAEIKYEEEGLENAIKTLNNGLKKYPNAKELYQKKLEFYFLSNNQEEIKKTLDEMNKALE